MLTFEPTEFDKSRTYRPRLLIQGIQGMGQQYLGGALLHKFERLHVQPFDLSALYSNPESVSAHRQDLLQKLY